MSRYLQPADSGATITFSAGRIIAHGGAACGPDPGAWSGAGGTSFCFAHHGGHPGAHYYQKAGGPQGNPAPVYYQLAAAEYGSAGRQFLQLGPWQRRRRHVHFLRCHFR